MRWKGKVKAWGVWFPPDSTTAENLLRLWEEGAQVLSAREGWLFIFPQPRRIDGERTPFCALVGIGQGWGSFPSASPAFREILLKWRGEVWSGFLHALPPADLGSLWSRSDLSYSEGRPLQLERVSRPSISPTSETNLNVRQTLAHVPPAAPEQKEWVRRLQETKPGENSTNPLLGLFDLLSSVFDSNSNRRYMSKMIGFFEREQWQEALRYAIPLNTGESHRKALERFFGKLVPRKELGFSPKQEGGRYIGTSTPGLDFLRELYYRAFESLKQAGQFERAAFVQAELLGDIDGALRLLEENELYRSAAQLATLKGKPASQQVKLWFQAGETERALQLARCHGAHAQAAHLLDLRDAEKARLFRADWSRDLMAAGNRSAAIEVGWRWRDDIPEFEDWIWGALEADDLAAGTVMALITTDPELSRKVDLASRLRTWFNSEDPFTLRRRKHLLTHLARHRAVNADPEVRQWAGEVARQVMRSSGTPWELGGDGIARCLITLSGDPWLRVDAPRMAKSRFGLERHFLKVEDRGRLPLFDAASLGDGRYLVALGHTGLAVVSRGGRFSQTFPQPAHSLVIPYQGDLFLTYSEGRLGCFQSDRARSLTSVEIDEFAGGHDDFDWIVRCGRDIFRIDLAALLGPQRRWQAFQSITHHDSALKLSAGPIGFSVRSRDSLTYYDVPGMKGLASNHIDSSIPVFQTPYRSYHYTRAHHFAGEPVTIRGQFVDFDYQSDHCVATSRDENGLTLCIFQAASPKQQLILQLPGASRAKMRARDEEVVICDDCGRLLIANPRTQTWHGKFFL